MNKGLFCSREPLKNLTVFVKSKALNLGKRVGEVKSSAWDHVVIGVYQGRFAREKKTRPSRRSLSIRRFWVKGGKMEAKKGESFFQLSPPSPHPHLKSPLP